MTAKQGNWKPPLPTAEQLAQAPITMSGIALKYFVERAFPGAPLPRARCAGKAPMFDAEPHKGEKYDQYKKRIFKAQLECSMCFEKEACAIKAELDPDPAGVLAGEIRIPRGDTSIRKAAA